MKRAALDYASRGFAVFPCYPRSKIPATDNGFLDAVSDRAGVHLLWRRKSYNIGIATGAKSGIVVLDVDGAEGEASLSSLTATHEPLPATLEASSGKGRHIYLGHPGTTVKTRQGILGPGIDIRADGGCIMAPPSIHPSGRRYEWKTPQAPIAKAPSWLVDLITREKERPKPRFVPGNREGSQRSPWADAEVLEMLATLSPDISRDEWLRVGMALHAGGHPFDMWDAWSRAGEKYQPGCTETAWRGFREGGVTMGTLVHMARARGWSTPIADQKYRGNGR